MPFDPAALTAPFRMQPGLRRVAPGTPAVHASPPDGAAFQRKLAVLREHADQCLVATTQADARPALVALGDAAATDCPQALRHEAGWLASAELGLALRLEDGALTTDPGAHRAAAELISDLPADWRAGALASLALLEDFALIDAEHATLPWMAVCLPSHWDPREKAGRDFASVHAPVADSAMLRQAGAHLLKLVSAGERWERFVWTVTTHPELDQHPARHTRRLWPAQASPAELLAMATLRSERQGFIPLPERREALFTIEVEVRPLASALQSGDTPGVDPQALHDALASMSDAVLAYRSLTPARDRLCRALLDLLPGQP